MNSYIVLDIAIDLRFERRSPRYRLTSSFVPSTYLQKESVSPQKRDTDSFAHVTF